MLALSRNFFLSSQIPIGGFLPSFLAWFSFVDVLHLYNCTKGILTARPHGGLSVYRTAASLAPDDAEIAFNLAAVLEAC